MLPGERDHHAVSDSQTVTFVAHFGEAPAAASAGHGG
jgi:hypothetical protein